MEKWGEHRQGAWYFPTTRKWKPDSVNSQTDRKSSGRKDYVWPQRVGR